jgi:hypothetical protein
MSSCDINEEEIDLNILKINDDDTRTNFVINGPIRIMKVQDNDLKKKGLSPREGSLYT